MGGCRCTFFSCMNSSSNCPGMHFFHFPLKKPDKLKLWIKYSRNLHFPELPLKQQKNKVICETHFRDECFMNYKKDRLVHMAVPTLIRLSNGKVLDFEESDKPKPKCLPPPTAKHLIPPEGVPRRAYEHNLIILPSELKDQEQECVNTSHNTSVSFSNKTSKIDEDKPAKVMKLMENPKILNHSYEKKTNLRGSKNNALEDIEVRFVPHKDIGTNQSFVILNDTNEVEEVTSDYLVQSSNPSTDNKIEEIHENVYEEIEIEEESLPSEETEEVIIGVEDDKNDPNEELISKNIMNEIIQEYEIKMSKLQEEIEKTRAEADKVKETMKKVPETKKSMAQVETVSTSGEAAKGNVVNTAQQSGSGSLTKTQLFTGIKRYLSPSIAALVRMEMFGKPEREWKSDEKTVSVELLRLGEEVFDYIRDEWRCRLPPKKDVHEWLSNDNTAEEEEDL